jgi:hypothetical protein
LGCDVGCGFRKLEIDKVGVVQEDTSSDARDTHGNRNIGQAGASCERMASDAGNAVGDCDASQSVAGNEGIVPNAGDAIWNCVASNHARRALDEHGAAFIEQDPGQTGIGAIV